MTLSPASRAFRFGDWLVRPADLQLQRGEQTVTLEPRLMQVLSLLCSAPGQVFSADELLQRCWDGAELGDNPVHKCLALLRKALGDSASQPRYIRTLRGQGYCTLADVELLDAPAAVARWGGDSPFVGLRAFDARHAPVFFGRGSSLQSLSESLARQAEPGRTGATLLLGASGSGKTSLVQAGLLPRLLAGDGGLRIASHAGLNLDEVAAPRWAEEFASALLDLERDGQPCFAGHSAATLAELLLQAPGEHDPLPALLPTDGPPQLLWLDKFEALLNPAQGLHAALPAVLALLERLDRCDGLLLLLVCRNDYYPALAQTPWLLASKAWGGQVDLARPHAAELAQMLRLPAQLAGLQYGMDAQGRRLDDLLLAELQGSPDALPLLQHMLTELYERRSPEGELRAADYQQLGGLEGAIAARAEAVFSALGEAEQRCLSGVLARLVVMAEEAEACTSQAARWQALGSEAERQLVRSLIDARLFAACLVQGEPGFRLSHEALLRRWPRVADWIAAHGQALRTRARLEAAALRWQDQLIPQGRPLDEAVQLEAHGLPLSAELQGLITASVRRARRQRLQMRALWASLLALALAALVFGVLARRHAAEAAEQQHAAEGLVGFMVGDLADALRPLGKLEVLERISDRALAQLGQAGAQEPAVALQQTRALLVLAEVAHGRGQSDTLQRALQQADVALQALQPRVSKSELALAKQLQLQRGTVGFWRGQAALDQGRTADAEQGFRSYLAHAEAQMALDPADRSAWIERSYALNSLGTLAMRRLDYPGAAQAFAESHALKERALQASPDDTTLRADLADTASWLGTAQIALGHASAARDAFAAEADTLQRLLDAQPRAGQWMQRLANARQRLAEVQAALGNRAEALTGMQQALRLTERALALDPDNLSLRVTRHRIAFERAQLQSAAVPAELRDALRTAQTRHPNEMRLHLLALQALSDEQPQAELAPALRQRLNGQPASHSAYARALLLQAAQWQRLKDPGRAQQRCEQAAELLAPQAAQSRDFRLLRVWVAAQQCLGRPADEALQRLREQNVETTRS